jgi:tetratricopeptide (TPR) repeat protein
MEKPIGLVVASTALLALAACVSEPQAVAGPAASASTSAGTDKASVYGLYLAGQAALDTGDSQTAAQFFNRAKEASPQAGFLKERAFTAALLSGDITGAAGLAPGPGEGSAGSQSLGVLAQVVDALADGRGAEAWAKLSQTPAGVSEGAPGAVLKPWAAAAAGRKVEALAVPATNDRLMRLVAGLSQAQLYEHAHRYAEAETGFKTLLLNPIGKGMVAPFYGHFLERRGRRQEALAIYEELLSADPGDPTILAARARVLAKGPAPAAPTIREGAAQALMAPAAAALAERQPEAALVYLRLALRLDPRRDDAWLLVGDVLGASGDVDGSRAALAKIPPQSPRYADARSRLAWSYQQADDKEMALKIARETVQQAPSSQTARLNLADILRANQQFEESAHTLDPVISAAGDHAEWRLYYMRAVALERSGHWPDAQRDLSKALTLKPDEPEVLNYLGYSWVNRGERVKEGLAMIEKAVAAQPEEGAYVDSLGWAYYRLAQYAKAVELLERAVSLDAGDAEINDHLGDAYWRIGRRDEARYQWQAVLTLKPDPDIKARAEAKLASPLGVDVYAQPPPVGQPPPVASAATDVQRR